MLLIFSRPQYPSINTHYRVIKIYSGFTQQVAFKTEPDVNNSIDEANRVDPDAFPTTKPNTCYTGKYCDAFKPRRLLEAVNKLINKILQGVCLLKNKKLRVKEVVKE